MLNDDEKMDMPDLIFPTGCRSQSSVRQRLSHREARQKASCTRRDHMDDPSIAAAQTGWRRQVPWEPMAARQGEDGGRSQEKN